MKKELLAGILIGLIIGFIASVFAAVNTFKTKIIRMQSEPVVIQTYVDEALADCVKAGGEYRVSNLAWGDEEDDYRAFCEIPEHTLWDIKLTPTRD